MADTNIKTLLGETWREDMTAEEIVSALETITLPQDNSDEVNRYKNAVTKANAEAADYKRKLKERMSEEEKRSAEEAERISKIEAENQALKKRITVAEYTTKFTELGMDTEMATKSAEAAFNGDFNTIFANFNTRLANVRESVKAELLNSTPALKGGSTEKVKDYSQEISASVEGADFVSAAALIRLQQENISNTTD